jgi:hypothetical protein
MLVSRHGLSDRSGPRSATLGHRSALCDSVFCVPLIVQQRSSPRSQHEVRHPDADGRPDADLREALEDLDKDRGFLKNGGVFGDDFIDSFIELKMTEVERFEMTLHPVEFDMYYSQ